MPTSLPPELLQIICDYAGVKNRNGKYMNQLLKSDVRYTVLQSMTKKDRRCCVVLKKCLILTFPSPEADIVTKYREYNLSDGYRIYCYYIFGSPLLLCYYMNFSGILIHANVRQFDPLLLTTLHET